MARPRFGGVLAALSLALFSLPAGASLISFSETVGSTAPGAGFNGRTNQVLYSSDYYYRYEAFSLGGDGVFDIESIGGNDVLRLDLGDGASVGSGFRITRMDGAAMNLFHLNLFGEVAVGQLDLSGGSPGSWALFEDTSGSAGNLALVDFGGQFTNLTEIFVADASFAGGTTRASYVDNAFANLPNPVPEPGTLALLGFGLAGLGLWRRRRT